MNVMTDVHPYLDGKAKRMLIDGKWLEAASGKTFETRNPATGEILAHVAEGGCRGHRSRRRRRTRCVQWAMEQVQASRTSAPAIEAG